MKDFQPLRYIRRFAAWMLIFVLVGTMGSYYVLKKMQKYTASTTLTFHDSAMEERGENPDGTELDITEVKSAEVVRAALEKVQTGYSMEEIRNSISISEVIPEDIMAIRNGAWEDGLEYIYYPTMYSVSCTLKTKDASLVLNAVLDSYLEYYKDTHMSFMRIPERAASLEDESYDYIEYAEALDAYFENDLDFLYKAADYWSDYRSNATGYSFEALKGVYQYEADQDITALYAQIIGGRITKDASLLIDRYTNRKEHNTLTIAEYQRSIDRYQNLISVYSSKRMDSYDYWENSNTENASDIVNEVYTVDNSSDSNKTVYDDWLEQCVNLNKAIANLQADTLYCDYVLDAFEGAGNATEEDASDVRKTINDIVTQMVSLDATLAETYAGYCEYAAAQSLTVNETPYSGAKYKMVLYMGLAVALLIAMAIVLAIVLGRILDFTAYLGLSVVKKEEPVPEKTEMPKLSACDAVIAEYAKSKLPIPFALMIFETAVKSENYLEAILGQVIGGRGRVVKAEDGRFFCFLEKGNSVLAETISGEVSLAVAEKAISCRSAFSVNSWAHLVSIAELVQETENKFMVESVEAI